MEFQIKDSKGQKLNYVNADPYKVAIKAHEWVEFNYSPYEVRVNFITAMMRNRTADQLLPDELRLLTVSFAIDYANEGTPEYDQFWYEYEKMLFEYLSVWTNAPVDYCRFLDCNGYIDFKILQDEED